MKKELFEAAEIEMITFDSNDIITTSFYVDPDEGERG